MTIELRGSAMDASTRDNTIRALKEHLDRCRLQAASLDNDSGQRNEMAETCYGIQLLLDFLERKDGNNMDQSSSPFPFRL